MKEQVKILLEEALKTWNIEVEDAFIEEVEGQKKMNIVLDREEIIDLNTITDASRVINEIMDKHPEILGDVDELDIYSKEKGSVE